jgi:hypothetical protein
VENHKQNQICCPACSPAGGLFGRGSIVSGYELRDDGCPRCGGTMQVVVKVNPPPYTPKNDKTS